MRTTCALVQLQLPSSDDGSLLGALDGHLRSCLRCQAELAKYRSLHRRLAELAERTYHAPPGFTGAVTSTTSAPLRLVEDTGDRSIAVRTTVAAAAGAAVVAAAAVALGVRRFIAA